MAPAISDIRRREEARIQTTFQAATTTVAIATASPSHTSPAQTTSPTTPTPIDASNGIGGTPGNIESPSSAGTTTVLIIVILCCASAIMSATLFYIFDRKKNAQFREACKRDPYLTRKEFARRRKLSALERLEEEELQRSIMIRKSLASRGPSRSNSCEDGFDLSSMQEQHHRRHHHHHHQMTDLDRPEPPRGRQQMREHREDLHHGRQLSGEWAPSEGRSRSGSETSSSASSARRAYTGPGCSGVDAEGAGVPLTPESSGSSRSVLDKETAPPPIHPMEEITRPLPAVPRADGSSHFS
ncbi:hypothetical protein CLIM01_01321 [Colletotrichum limetticola]|uniref:Uncharacterized protein n=1 Tax=Colletotrichum limetticola TaxID=1209924 RepID=A0ABQ9QBZ1_9PEZI|nr:hypothetical protein CLIM01_01321 [Colletotrichum limetticola]